LVIWELYHGILKLAEEHNSGVIFFRTYPSN
jgi:hypothetical protein